MSSSAQKQALFFPEPYVVTCVNVLKRERVAWQMSLELTVSRNGYASCCLRRGVMLSF